MSQKEAYQEKIEAQLREWTAKIKELKAKADGAKADAKIEMYKQLEALQVKQETAQAQFQGLKQVGSDKWDKIRISLDQAMADLNTTWESTRSQREHYQEQVETQIREWAAKLKEMTVKAQQASGEVKAKMLQEIAAMGDHKDELQQKLAELKSAGVEKWESLKESIEKSRQDLKKTLESLKKIHL